MPFSLKQVEKSLRSLSAVKKRAEAEYAQWLQCGDAIQWLAATSKDLIPIAVWMGHIYIYSVLVPVEALTGDLEEDVGKWSLSAPSGWGYSITLDASSPGEARLTSPIEGTGICSTRTSLLL